MSEVLVQMLSPDRVVAAVLRQLNEEIEGATACFATDFRYKDHGIGLECERKMLVEGVDATKAAFEVGYESASQFTREYKRLFGQPPKRDVRARRLGS